MRHDRYVRRDRLQGLCFELSGRLWSETDCRWLWLVVLMSRVSRRERRLEHANEVPNPLSCPKLQRQTSLSGSGRRNAQITEVESAAKVAVEL